MYTIHNTHRGALLLCSVVSLRQLEVYLLWCKGRMPIPLMHVRTL